MRFRAFFGGVVVLVACAASAYGQVESIQQVGAEQPVLTRQERIAQVVDELNARSVKQTLGVSVTGTRGAVDGPAAWTIENVNGRGIGGCFVDVALLGADFSADDVAAEIVIDPRIGSITVIDATAVVPTVAELLAFDAVMTYTDSPYINPVAIGDVLADYVDAGGGVVLSMFAMNEPLIFPNITPTGRFLTDNYYCIERDTGPILSGVSSLGTVHVPGSPVMKGVTSFNGGAGSFRPSTGPHPRAMRVADWGTGEILVATRDDLAGKRVDLGFFPVSNLQQGNGWDSTTDGNLLIANALVYAGGCPNVGLFGCGASLYRQGPNIGLGSFNSNTPSNLNFFQVWADSFVLPAGSFVHRVTLWGAYWGDETVPAIAQRFVLNIHSDAAGLPGPIIYTETVYAEPEWIGGQNSESHRVYRFTLTLAEPFEPAGGVRYWLSPLGDINEHAWSWQRRTTTNGSAWQFSIGTWFTQGDDVAFELCGFCDCLCPGDADFDGDVDLDDLQLLLFNFGFTCL